LGFLRKLVRRLGACRQGSLFMAAQWTWTLAIPLSNRRFLRSLGPTRSVDSHISRLKPAPVLLLGRFRNSFGRFVPLFNVRHRSHPSSAVPWSPSGFPSPWSHSWSGGSSEAAYSASSPQWGNSITTGGNSFSGTPSFRYRNALTRHVFFLRRTLAATSATE